MKSWGHLDGSPGRRIDDERQLSSVLLRVQRARESLFDPQIGHPANQPEAALEIQLLFEREFIVHRLELEVEAHVQREYAWFREARANAPFQAIEDEAVRTAVFGFGFE